MNRILGMLGMAQRCGRLVTGEAPCRAAVRSGAACLVLVDEGASAGSRKTLGDACAHYGVPMGLLPPGELGQATGRPGRMAAAVTDASFAQRLMSLLDEQSLIKPRETGNDPTNDRAGG